MNDGVFYTLVALNVLFFSVVFIYVLLQIDRRNKIIHSKFIKGTWQRKGLSDTGESWHISYTFDDTHYRIKAHPAFSSSGRYKVVKEVENLIVLQFLDIEPSSDGNTNPHTVSIAVDTRAQQLTIDGHAYKRLG